MIRMNNDMLSQEEIDFLLRGVEDDDSSNSEEEIINDVQKDALGEIGNISMGTAATTLSTLLNKKVTITTPKVEITTTGELSHQYTIPFVAVDVKYKEGLEGSNILIMNTNDVKIITDIMMGNDEFNLDRELTELDLSAISEVMNQMMGSAATSVSGIFSKKVDIEPPKAYEITFSEGKETFEILKTDEPIIKISFSMIVEDLINSEIMQLIPSGFGNKMVENLMGNSEDIKSAVNTNESEDKFKNSDDSKPNRGLDKDVTVEKPIKQNTDIDIKDDVVKKEQVVVKKPEFEMFNSTDNDNDIGSIDLVGDIPVELTVELGRTKKRISEILKYGQGTVIELDKLVGEALNIYANGKFIAKGEVVVIDDNFGIRITDIDNVYGK